MTKTFFSTVFTFIVLGTTGLLAQTKPAEHYQDLRYPSLNKIQPPKPERFTLANGVTVYLVQDHELPMITVSALIRAGSRWEPVAKAGLADIVGTVMRTGGTATRNGDKLENGVLEGSANGSSWAKLADFSDGVAVAQAAAGTRQLRVRVTKPQENWLIVHEILVE